MDFRSHANLITLLLTVSGFFLCLSSAEDTITSTQFIRDPQTVTSNNSDFKLGFFTPVNSTNRYVGIWYLSESDVIWVANRNQPLATNSSGIVRVSEDGNLVVLNRENKAVWSSNVSHIATNSSAKLSDNGNLILLDDTTGEVLWESFQHPSDTLVPKMKLSVNRITGEKVYVTSWKGPSDPSVGYYSATLERPNAPEVFVWVNGTRPYYRIGPWNGQTFMGSPLLSGEYLNESSARNEKSGDYLNGWSVRNEDGTVYLTYNFAIPSLFGLITLNPKGQLRAAVWLNRKEVWRGATNFTYCDLYGRCGPFGSCNLQNLPICSCLSGFEPKNQEEWDRNNWTSGCVRRAPLQCEVLKNGSEKSKDGFLKLENMKVPDLGERSASVEDQCRAQCLQNCSCVAYAYDLGGVGCMYWSGDLADTQRFSSGGVDLYIRVALSELDADNKERHADKRRVKGLIIAVGVSIGMVTLAGCAYLSRKWTAEHTGETHSQGEIQRMIEDQKQVKLDDQLFHFNFEELTTATNNFSLANKLGKGGFGVVYRGQLHGGQEIAVKRLSKTSGQGLEEFINEVLVISKLQHRNLVRLLGYCIEREEKMLIYEYMPNKSLDALLFDPIKKKDLDWPKRFNIIEGISRGLLYLHRDSRLKIVHRDLKVSNILLDRDLNPKISDFGMAKIFEDNFTEANTRRVVGTFGYMPPEYAFRGLFSEKSDVFSFGVLLLEIISGRKISSYYGDDQSMSLLGYAWKLWNKEDILSLIDPEICNPDYTNGILRCIHIGLLCVQEVARDRPTVATIISMLNNEIANLPLPSHPAFIEKQTISGPESSQQGHGTYSTNDVTVTDMQGR